MAGQDAGKDVKTSRLLFLDDRNVSRSDNAVIKLGDIKKHSSNPLMREDKAWEKRFDNFYGNIIFDKQNDIYKCWYSPFIVANSSAKMSFEDMKNIQYEGHEFQEMAICYATSADGLVWDKPELNLVDFNGSKLNNIIFRGPHGGGIFYDKEDTDNTARYKLLFQGLKTSLSRDGLIWSQHKYLASVKASGNEKITGDTHNNALWAPTLSKYVAFTRTWAETDREVVGKQTFLNHKWTRQVSRIESDDFRTWSNSEVCITCTKWEHQPYAMPVFYHAGVYFGLLAIHDQVSDRVWTELAWSKDSVKWERVEEGTPFIQCSDNELDYDYGCVYACATPVFLDDEVRIFYGASDWLHTSWRNGYLALATLRPDGFAGYEQIDKSLPATIISSILSFKDCLIKVTIDMDSDGWVIAKLFNDSKEQISASHLTNSCSDEILFDSRLSDLETGYLEFEFKNARLYSFCLDYFGDG